MSYIVKQGEDINYQYKEIVVDTEAEVSGVSTEGICPGSILYLIENGNFYMLNTKKKWIKQ